MPILRYRQWTLSWGFHKVNVIWPRAPALRHQNADGSEGVFQAGVLPA